MPPALRLIRSRFILHIKCNLLNNESPLLLRPCELSKFTQRSQPPPHQKTKKQPLRSLSDPRCNSNETLSTSKTRVQEVRRPRAANPKPCRGCYKEDEEAVLHGATAWVCVDMLLNMKSKKNKTRIKPPLADTLFMFCSFWGFHMSGHS